MRRAPPLEILKNHLFNWAIWPDFTEIPTPEAPFLRYEEIELGDTIRLGGRAITPLPANHTVPAVGYHLDSGAASLVFTGDTGPNDALWRVVNRIANLKYLIIETAFSNKERHLAEISRHLCPDMLAEELAKLERNAEIYITHLKPGEIELTMQEIEECAGEFAPAHAAEQPGARVLAPRWRAPRPRARPSSSCAGSRRSPGSRPSASPSWPRSRTSSTWRAAPIRSPDGPPRSRCSCSRGELLLVFQGGGTLVVVGGTRRDHATRSTARSRTLARAQAPSPDVDLLTLDDELLDILATWDQVPPATAAHRGRRRRCASYRRLLARQPAQRRLLAAAGGATSTSCSSASSACAWRAATW